MNINQMLSQQQAEESKEPLPEDQAPKEQVPEDQAEDPTAVTPEEQQAYDGSVLAAIAVIYEDGRSKKIAKTLKDMKDNPVQVVIHWTGTILGEIDDAANGRIPETMVLHIADAILAEIVDIAEKSGAFMVDERLGNSMRREMVMQIAQEYGAEADDLDRLVKSFNEEELAQIRAEQEGYDAAPVEDVGDSGVISQNMGVE